jgi:hypothetical protein
VRYVAALFILFALPVRVSAQYADPVALTAHSRGLGSPPAIRGDKQVTSAHVSSAARRSAALDSLSGHNSQQTLAGLAIGMSVGVATTIFLVKHCERTSTNNEGPPCAVGYVVPGVPIVAASGLIGAIIGSKQPKSNGIGHVPARSSNRESMREQQSNGG